MYVKKILLHSLFYLLVSWAWWDWPLTWLTNHRPSVLWHCWLGHVTLKTVSEMTYNVSSGTLNSTIPYHTSPHKQGLYVMILLFCLSFTWNTRTCRALADLPSSSTVLVAVSMCSAARQSGQCPTYECGGGLPHWPFGLHWLVCELLFFVNSFKFWWWFLLICIKLYTDSVHWSTLYML